MGSNILKYTDFNESMMVNVPNKDKGSKKLDFRKFCSWDDISFKSGFLRLKQSVRVYYSPVRKTIISIEPKDAFSKVKEFPFQNGDSKDSVRDFIDNNPKYKLEDSYVKKFRGPKR